MAQKTLFSPDGRAYTPHDRAEATRLKSRGYREARPASKSADKPAQPKS